MNIQYFNCFVLDKKKRIGWRKSTSHIEITIFCYEYERIYWATLMLRKFWINPLRWNVVSQTMCSRQAPAHVADHKADLWRSLTLSSYNNNETRKKILRDCAKCKSNYNAYLLLSRACEFLTSPSIQRQRKRSNVLHGANRRKSTERIAFASKRIRRIYYLAHLHVLQIGLEHVQRRAGVSQRIRALIYGKLQVLYEIFMRVVLVITDAAVLAVRLATGETVTLLGDIVDISRAVGRRSSRRYVDHVPGRWCGGHVNLIRRDNVFVLEYVRRCHESGWISILNIRHWNSSQYYM